MKENEIIIGESYLFANTDIIHRKNMVGTIVEVVSKVKGNKKKPDYLGLNGGTKPTRFKLSNGQYANASNLKTQ